MNLCLLSTSIKRVSVCLSKYHPLQQKYTVVTAAAALKNSLLQTYAHSYHLSKPQNILRELEHRTFVEENDFKVQIWEQRHEDKFLFFSSLKNPSGTVQTCCLSAWTALTDNSWQSFCHAIGQLGHGCHGYRHTQALSVLTFWQCPPTHGMERELQGMMKRETSRNQKWNRRRRRKHLCHNTRATLSWWRDLSALPTLGTMLSVAVCPWEGQGKNKIWDQGTLLGPGSGARGPCPRSQAGLVKLYLQSRHR